MLDNIFRIVNDFNDLDKLKVYNLISQKGGGAFDIMKFMFGIIILVIGGIFLFLPSYYSNTTANVSNINTDSLYKYVTLSYNVNNINYNKEISLAKNHDITLNSNITIYYDSNDPNLISIDLNTYYIMGGIFLLFGLYIIILNDNYNIGNILTGNSGNNDNNKNNNSKNKPGNIFDSKTITDTSIYNTDYNLDNIKIR